jgi:hypothetical protein
MRMSASVTCPLVMASSADAAVYCTFPARCGGSLRLTCRNDCRFAGFSSEHLSHLHCSAAVLSPIMPAPAYSSQTAECGGMKGSIASSILSNWSRLPWCRVGVGGGLGRVFRGRQGIRVEPRGGAAYLAEHGGCDGECEIGSLRQDGLEHIGGAVREVPR